MEMIKATEFLLFMLYNVRLDEIIHIYFSMLSKNVTNMQDQMQFPSLSGQKFLSFADIIIDLPKSSNHVKKYFTWIGLPPASYKDYDMFLEPFLAKSLANIQKVF